MLALQFQQLGLKLTRDFNAIVLGKLKDITP